MNLHSVLYKIAIFKILHFISQDKSGTFLLSAEIAQE